MDGASCFAGIAAGAQYGDGASPNGGLVADSQGRSPGQPTARKHNCAHQLKPGCGIFQAEPRGNGSWMEKQIHLFRAGDDGAGPLAGVFLDSAGALYGAANGGANECCGVVFRVAPTSGGKYEGAVIYNFGGNSYSYGPAQSGVDALGNVYGTTSVGLGSSDGSVFRLMPPAGGQFSWSVSFLYEFRGGSDSGCRVIPRWPSIHQGTFMGHRKGGGAAVCVKATAALSSNFHIAGLATNAAGCPFLARLSREKWGFETVSWRSLLDVPSSFPCDAQAPAGTECKSPAR